MSLKPCKTIEDVRENFTSIKSTVAGDTRFGAQALLFIAERLHDLTVDKKLSEMRQKRPLTEWQKFIKAGLKAGQPITQLATEWHARKTSIVKS